MNTVAQISYDAELVPEGYTRRADGWLRQWEQRLFGLGSKDSPLVEGGHQFHPDGVAAEMAPISPFKSPGALLAEFDKARQRFSWMLEATLVGKDNTDLSEFAGFDAEAYPRMYPSAMEFGCSPDYIKGFKREVPEFVVESPIREHGMHFHLNLRPEYCDQRTPMDVARGVEPTNVEACAEIADEADRQTRFLFNEVEGDARPWYRVPGLYRPKPYGIEYRSFGASVVADWEKFGTLTNILFNLMVNHLKAPRIFV